MEDDEIDSNDEDFIVLESKLEKIKNALKRKRGG